MVWYANRNAAAMQHDRKNEKRFPKGMMSTNPVFGGHRKKSRRPKHPSPQRRLFQ